MPKQLVKHNLGTSSANDNSNVSNTSPQPRVAKSYPTKNVPGSALGPEQGRVTVSATKVSLDRSAANHVAVP